MNLAPNNTPLIGAEFEIGIYPSKTYALDLANRRVTGTIDGIEVVRQAVYKALRTERFQHEAYSANYGAELTGLIGAPTGYALPELERCITEALTWDSRIESVDGFEFETKGNAVHARFTVHSIYGDTEEETEVMI